MTTRRSAGHVTGQARSASPPDSMLQQFLAGDDKVLQSAARFENIVDELFAPYKAGRMDETLMFMERLGETACSDHRSLRQGALIILSMTAEKILDSNNEDLLEAISRILGRWLQTETEYRADFEIICRQLNSLIHKMLDSGLWSQAESLVATLKDIKAGILRKNRLLRQVVCRTHSSIAGEVTLDRLTACYLDVDCEGRSIAGSLLLHLGDRSIPHLVKTLAGCKNRDERFRLLDLIPGAGEEAIPFLTDQLAGTAPWYVTRNIILLLSRIGNADLYRVIRPHLQHRDVRVQEETVNCIQALNGTEEVGRLLEALNLCDHSLKPKLIDLLGRVSEPRVTRACIGLLNNLVIFETSLQNEIIQGICNHIDKHLQEGLFTALERVLADDRTRKDLSAKTLAAIEAACRRIREQLQDSPVEPPVPSDSAGSGHRSASDSAGEGAGPAGTGADPSQPRWFREVFEGAPPEPFRVHLLSRQSFYTGLEREQFIIFSDLLTHERCTPGDILVAAGDVDSTLFFVDSARIAVLSAAGEQLATLQPGDIYGRDPGRNGSPWEVTLRAEETGSYSAIDQGQLQNLQSDAPGLYRKVSAFIDASVRKTPGLPALSAGEKKSARQEQETVPFTGDIGDHIADARIIRKSGRHMAFSFHLPAGIDYTLFQDAQLSISLSCGEESGRFTAEVKGLEFAEEERLLTISACFTAAPPRSESICHAISLR